MYHLIVSLTTKLPRPLNSIGMPYYDTLLLSSWTSKFLSTSIVAPPPPKIPSQILSTMKFNDNVAYASLPKELRGRRNVVQSVPRKSTGRFRSGRRKIEVCCQKSALPQFTYNFYQLDPDTPTYEYEPDEIPKLYRKVEIEYSKFGVEDFDFGYVCYIHLHEYPSYRHHIRFFNHTDYSGLETHIINSYTNAMLQLMHFTHPIRLLAKSHISTDCQREHCLLCELGFVVRMLEDAKGTNCQSSNFCKTVGVLAQSAYVSLYLPVVF